MCTLQGVLSKLAGGVSGKAEGKKTSRQNSRTGRKRSGGTELEHFEDARTGMISPEDSLDGSYNQSPRALAEPMATHK